MLAISSNISRVCERLEKFQAAIPGAIQESLKATPLWEEQAKAVAGNRLRGQFPDSKYEPIIDRFVNSVTAFGALTISGSFENAKNIDDPTAGITGYGGNEDLELDAAELNLTYEDVLQWVQAGKRGEPPPAKDIQPGEGGESDSAIAWRVYNALYNRPEQANIQRMASAIAQYIYLKNEGGASIDLTEWMQAVLDAWSEMVSDELPPIVLMNIRKAWRATKV